MTLTHLPEARDMWKLWKNLFDIIEKCSNFGFWACRWKKLRQRLVHIHENEVSCCLKNYKICFVHRPKLPLVLQNVFTSWFEHLLRLLYRWTESYSRLFSWLSTLMKVKSKCHENLKKRKMIADFKDYMSRKVYPQSMMILLTSSATECHDDFICYYWDWRFGFFYEGIKNVFQMQTLLSNWH